MCTDGKTVIYIIQNDMGILRYPMSKNNVFGVYVTKGDVVKWFSCLKADYKSWIIFSQTTVKHNRKP